MKRSECPFFHILCAQKAVLLHRILKLTRNEKDYFRILNDDFGGYFGRDNQW